MNNLRIYLTGLLISLSILPAQAQENKKGINLVIDNGKPVQCNSQITGESGYWVVYSKDYMTCLEYTSSKEQFLKSSTVDVSLLPEQWQEDIRYPKR